MGKRCLGLVVALLMVFAPWAGALPPEEAYDLLIAGNEAFTRGEQNGNISDEHRRETANSGQQPYAVVVTCSDSRVAPDHIFSAGLGDLFVVQTAGHVVDETALASIQYGVGELGANVVVVMGHIGCGMVQAAIEGSEEEYLQPLLRAVQKNIGAETDPALATSFHVSATTELVRASFAEREEELYILEALYDMETGFVDFLVD